MVSSVTRCVALSHVCSGLRVIEISLLSHFALGKDASFVAFVGLSFQLGCLNEEQHYLSF